MPTRSQDQNLDSLLDTMANVVGILVVLIAVTQLSVGDAVDRISQSAGREIEVSPAEVALMRTRSEALQDSIVAAEADLAARTPTAKRTGLLLDELRPHIENLEALEGRYELGGDGAPKLAGEIDRLQAAVTRLSAEVADAEARASGLEALLADVASETRPKIARLPNPRPPPASAEQVAIFCRYGRVSLLDLPGMNATLETGIRGALGDNRLPSLEDRAWLTNLFDKVDVGSGNFRWSIRDDGDARRMFADIEWVDRSAGEQWSDLQRGDSEFVRALSQIRRSGRYLRFYVWSDSFEVYLEARFLAEQMGWQIGWLPIEKDEEVGQSLVGGNRRPVVLD